MQPKKSTSRSYQNIILKTIALLVVWRVLLGVVISHTHARHEPTPSFPYYNELLTRMTPSQAVWAYFDGIHYLRVARYLYEDMGTQAFFPLYPLVVRGIGQLGFELEPSAFFLNATFLFCGSLALYLLTSSFWPLILLLSFPTSFFLGSVYTESMFLALSLVFFLSLKNKHYLLAAVLAGLASGTRLVGIFLSLSLIVDILANKSSATPHNSFPIIRYSICLALSLSGFLAYTYFLNAKYHDPLMFFHVQSMFGAERSSGEIVLLPQVIYRYLKMIFTVDPHTWLFQRIWLELVMFIGACFLWFKNLSRVPLSWSVYSGLSLLVPTLTGTLSSIPRYLLVLVPFLVPPTKNFRLLTIPFLLLLIYLFSLYSRGLFVG